MKQAKSLFSKAAFNSIVTVVITQINQRQTFGDGGGWKLYSKLKHYKLLTSGHSLPLRNHSCPFSVYCLSVGTAYCDTEPWNFCPVIRNTVCEGPYSCTSTFWPLSALGEEAFHCREREREKVLLAPDSSLALDHKCLAQCLLQSWPSLLCCWIEANEKDALTKRQWNKRK